MVSSQVKTIKLFQKYNPGQGEFTFKGFAAFENHVVLLFAFRGPHLSATQILRCASDLQVARIFVLYYRLRQNSKYFFLDSEAEPEVSSEEESSEEESD